jgi:hypothetical protein
MGWISFDQRDASAFHLVSDSRITWGSSEKLWNGGRKVFACKTIPDVFGYCMDVLYPSLVLGQIVDAIDGGLLFRQETTAEQKHQIFLDRLRESHSLGVNAEFREYRIFHITRIGLGLGCSFKAWETHFDPNKGFKDKCIKMPDQTDLVFARGSGEGSVKNSIFDWSKLQSSGFSRGLLGAFCDALESQQDTRSGGSPQLASIYRIGPSHSIGFMENGNLSLNGLPLTDLPGDVATDFYDRNFQRINPHTKELLKGAQPQPRPRASKK